MRIFGKRVPLTYHGEGSHVVETVSLGEVDDRRVSLVITNRVDVEVRIGCAPGERDVLTFSVRGWHAVEERVLEGLSLVHG